VAAAVTAGHRRFTAVAVVTGAAHATQPCGACRQFLAEFGTALRVLAAGADGATLETPLAELLPGSFRLDTQP
jgi:cytidine deaminase